MATYLLPLIVFLSFQEGEYNPTSAIYGQVRDDETGEALIGVDIQLFQEGKKLPVEAFTDIDGNYELGPLYGGIYDMQLSYVGYPDTYLNGINLKDGQRLAVDMRLKATDFYECGVPHFYEPPLINMGGHISGQTLTFDDFENRPNR